MKQETMKILKEFSKPFYRLNCGGIEIEKENKTELKGISHKEMFSFINDLLQVRASEIANRLDLLVSLGDSQPVQTAEKVEIPIKSIAFSRQQHIGKAFRHLYEACLNKTDLRGFIEKEEPIIAPLHETDATGQMMYADLEKFVSKWMED